ncbi:isoprenyl transferase [Bdellovibrionota bacterium]
MSSLKQKRKTSSKYEKGAPVPSSFSLPTPKHVAIIMDGNGRWAESRSKSRLHGHLRGTKVIKPIIKTADELGIKILTLWAFSLDNWKRPSDEVSFLTQLLERYLKKEKQHLMENNIQLQITGKSDDFPTPVSREINETIQLTKNNDGLILNIALSYGGREELLEAIQAIAKRVKEGDCQPSEINPSTIKQHLYTSNLPDPDLIIRTSGEYRLSNFLLWQSAYSELYFTSTYWPDFTPNHFREAIGAYQSRERRGGLTGTQYKKGLT